MQFVIEYTQAAHSLCRCPFLFHAYEVFLPNPVLLGDGAKTIDAWRWKVVKISYLFRIHLLIEVCIPSRSLEEYFSD